MDALLMLIVTVSAATGIAWGLLYLHEFITRDGQGDRVYRYYHPAPRSRPDESGRHRL